MNNSELTYEGLLWVMGICGFMALAIVVFFGFLYKDNLKVLFQRAFTRLKNLWIKVKTHRKCVVALLLGLFICLIVVVFLNWETVSQEWFADSLEEKLVEINKEYNGLINAEQDIQNLQSGITNLQSKITKLEQRIQEKTEVVKRLKKIVVGKELADKIAVGDKSHTVRDLIREIKIIYANLDSLNFNLKSFNQEKTVLVKRLESWKKDYIQNSNEYIKGIQLNSHLRISGNIGENHEIAEAVMNDNSLADRVTK